MAVENYFSELLVRKMGMEPTSGQRELFEKLGRFLTVAPSEFPLLVVRGYAGTGKTTAVSAFIKVLKELKHKFVLLAPTGRAAKVLSNYSGMQAKTIHKQIYRQRSLSDKESKFAIDFNKSRDTVYIVDEASLITIGSGFETSIFGTGDLLDDLISYIRQNSGNKLILMGDSAQLPPIGLEESPALDFDYVSQYSHLAEEVTLTEVVRQAGESGILYNATLLREEIERGDLDAPRFRCRGFDDFRRISGGELIEELDGAISKYGLDEVVVLCRSNMRANRYNMGIRQTVLFMEEQLTRGDKLMIVKNCYQFLENVPDLDFIANGDVAELVKIGNYEERYGLHFAQATLKFPDYNDVEIDAKIILDTLSSVSPSLDREQQQALFEGVYADYEDITVRKKRMEKVREDKYYNALQIKYAAAITGHKSQGGQWKCVFVDNNLWKDEISLDDKKWLYTAMTRAVEKVYLVNFNDKYFE
ncbi:MAG: AAA family ATPase [Bacteroidales bacterium]|nr:AAA family ATPase [Bacteroidales bacterium]